LIGLGGTINLAVQWQIYDQIVRPEAVVTQDKTLLREGNGTSYPGLLRDGLPIMLNVGVEIRVVAERPNGWAKIQTDTGDTGWIPRSSLVFVCP